MPSIRRAIVNGTGRTFAAVDVYPWVLDNPDNRTLLLEEATSELGVPVALAAEIATRKWRVWGDRDDLHALRGREIDELDWENHRISEAPRAPAKEFHAACVGTGRRECPTCNGRAYVIAPRGERQFCPGLCQSGLIKCRPCGGTGYY